VREATLLAHEQQSSLLIDGPLQYDAAANETVARQLAPNSQVAGKATKNARVSTTAITRSINNDTTNPAATSANALGGNA
ncbi:phosphate acyltransferase, partial [Klebsiella pneumoniae]|uniref:phosphate acyltransferase n=1 Tax=Klebsiella pneumoniae TaxID=573 RepID=UPI00273132DE